MKLNPIIFGTSCLGNLYREIPMETKVSIAAEWFRAYGHPTIDSAGKYGAGLSLECIGKALKALGKTGNDIDSSVKLGWRRSRRLAPGEEPTFEPGAWGTRCRTFRGAESSGATTRREVSSASTSAW